MKILITGGHHSSALPVIRELKLLDKSIEFYWVGHRHSLKGDKNDTLEYIEISNLGIPFYDLSLGKFYGYAKLQSVYKLARGFFRSYTLIKKMQPNVVLSFGGYIAVPVAFAAWLYRIPIVTHEQTVVAGYANRFISIFASKVFLSFDASKKYFNLNKVVLTGLPLREDIFEVKSSNFIINSHLPTVYVTGGKTGAHKLNEAILKILPDLLQVSNVIHQTGDYSEFNDYTKATRFYEDIKGEIKGKYFLRKYVLDNEIGEAFAKSSLVISRSGAHIVQELYALNKHAILVPIPWVSHNEQQLNALYLKSTNNVYIYDESDLQDTNKFLEVIKANLNIAKTGINAKDYTYAAKKIAQETLEISKKG